MKDFCPCFFLFPVHVPLGGWNAKWWKRKKEEIQANYHCWVNTEDGYVYLLPRKEQI